MIVILKLAGQSCNIDCLYCYERRKPDEGGRLSASEVSALLVALSGRRVHCILHGGEPLLAGKTRVREILTVISDFGSVVSTSIQTNGILLDPDWIDLFDSELPGMAWGVSFDGLGDLSRFRVDYKGRAATAEAVRGIELLGELGKSFGLICVVTSAHVGRGLEYFRTIQQFRGLREVKLLPCYDEEVQLRERDTVSRRLAASMVSANGKGKPGWTVSPDDYARFVESAQEEWISSGAWRNFALEPSASIAMNIAGQEGSYTDFSLIKDNQVLTLYPGGRIAGHDRALEVSSGQASVDQVQSFVESELEAASRDWRPFLDACDKCVAWSGCKGGELHTRKSMRAAGLSEEYCNARRALVARVEQIGFG